MSLCFSALASFHTPHHMESGRQAASLDSRLLLLSVFCLFFFYLLFNHSGGLTVSQFTVYDPLAVLTHYLTISLFLSDQLVFTSPLEFFKVAAGC